MVKNKVKGKGKMKIRTANKKDWREYLKLKKETLKEYSKIAKEKINVSDKQIKKEFNEFFSSNKRFLLIAEENNNIKGYLIGSLIINVYQKTGYIDDLFVLKDSRKKGIGSSLIKKFISILKKRKIKRYRLGVNLRNKKAINLYKKLGFKITHYEMDKKIK